jgi:hypothetical protein
MINVGRKKLSLDKTTLRSLSATALALAVGAVDAPTARDPDKTLNTCADAVCLPSNSTIAPAHPHPQMTIVSCAGC